MTVLTTLKELRPAEALRQVDEGAAVVDLRRTQEYLDAHIPGSLSLFYERGPGMPSRARDCLPLEVPLVLLEVPGIDLPLAAAGLRGKGFPVAGVLHEGMATWTRERGMPASTEVAEGERPAATVIDVGDPGAVVDKPDVHIPIERMWDRAAELAGERRVAIAAGYGVRASLAIGILERTGMRDIVFWKTRVSSRPSPSR